MKKLFSEVLEIKNGKNQKLVEDPMGNYPIYGSGGEMGRANNFICEAETVIIGRKGTINNPLFVNEPFWNVDTAFGLCANRELLYPKYLFHFCKSFDFNTLSTTVTIPSLTKTNLLDIKIPLPSLPEQQKIAAHLDTIQSAIDNKKQQLQQLDELVKSKFNELIMENGKWKVVKLGDLCEIKSGGTPNRNNQEYWENGNIPWVKTTELRNEELSEIEEFITQKGLDESAAKIVPENTILLAMYGQGKTRGMTAFLTVPASTNQACACILPTKSTEVLQRFIWYFLIMNYENIRNLAVGCNQLNLNSNLVKSIEIPLPPIELQNTFAIFVQKIDSAKSIIKTQLADLQELLDSKMDEYFGE